MSEAVEVDEEEEEEEQVQKESWKVQQKEEGECVQEDRSRKLPNP